MEAGGSKSKRTSLPSKLESRSSISLLSTHKRTPIHVRWQNISYSVPVNNPHSTGKCCSNDKVDKVILQNISGEAKPGKLVAIMGPSGSGKTSLLNCLAKRIPEEEGSHLEGRIALNGVNREEIGSKFARIAAYVQQDDLLFSMQTVEETLCTAAKLRLSKNLTKAEKQAQVNGIIEELGLSKVRNSRIGDALNRGVSGGERKRTSIGVEMIQDPSLLFLDEVTSGLDAFQALNVVQTLKILCEHQCTVIMSIHQPRSSIFQLFDQLILLSEGKLVYCGDAGETVVNYFDNLGFVCPHLFNPADHFLDIVSVNMRSPTEEQQSRQRIDMLVKHFNDYKLSIEQNNNLNIVKTEKNCIDSNNNACNNLSSLDKFVPQKSVHSSYWDQLVVLTIRAARQLLRDKITLSINLCTSLFFALLLAAIYNEVDDGQSSIQDKQGALFFVAINETFGPMMRAVNTFTVEKAIVMRERQAKSYHLSSYYLTKLVVYVPMEIVSSVVFCSIFYWIVGLKDDFEAFVWFVVITTLAHLVAMSLGFFCGAVTPNIDAANAMAPSLMILAILFGGFYINSDNIPVWLAWLEYFSNIRWLFMAYAINEFEDSKFTGCDVDQSTGCSASSCIENGNQVLKNLGMKDWEFWEPIVALVSWCVINHLIAYLVLKCNQHKYMQLSDPQHGDDTLGMRRLEVSQGSGGKDEMEVGTEKLGGKEKENENEDEDPNDNVKLLTEQI